MSGEKGFSFNTLLMKNKLREREGERERRKGKVRVTSAQWPTNELDQ